MPFLLQPFERRLFPSEWEADAQSSNILFVLLLPLIVPTVLLFSMHSTLKKRALKIAPELFFVLYYPFGLQKAMINQVAWF